MRRSAARVLPVGRSLCILASEQRGRIMRTIEQHAQALASGSTSGRALVEQCLGRIADPDGEGARTFIKVHAEQARAMADAMDTLRRARREPSRYAGIPV